MPNLFSAVVLTLIRSSWHCRNWLVMVGVEVTRRRRWTSKISYSSHVSRARWLSTDWISSFYLLPSLCQQTVGRHRCAAFSSSCHIPFGKEDGRGAGGSRGRIESSWKECCYCIYFFHCYRLVIFLCIFWFVPGWERAITGSNWPSTFNYLTATVFYLLFVTSLHHSQPWTLM